MVGFFRNLPAAEIGSMAKVHRSALCIIPPEHCWPAIQAIRADRDKSYYRWMPHINVLYPFRPDTPPAAFADAARRAAEALATVPPFTLSLAEFRTFVHGRRSATVWLRPEDAVPGSLHAMHAALLAAFPDCTDLSDDPGRGIVGWTPHLSVGQAGGGEAAERVRAELAATWRPLQFDVASVALISRSGGRVKAREGGGDGGGRRGRRSELDSPDSADPFVVRYEVDLGGGGVEEVDRAYAPALR